MESGRKKAEGVGVRHPQLSPKEREVLSYYNKGYMSSSALASRLKISSRAVRFHLQSLRRKGYLPKHLPPTAQTQPMRYAHQEGTNVHAQRFRCYVHWASANYKPTRFFQIGGVDVQCQGKEILLRASKEHRFYGDTEDKAMWKSLSFWIGIIRKVENRCGVIIIKPNSAIMDWEYHEWETNGSVVAKDARQRGQMWRVYHSEDGKLRLTTDFSNNTPSHETHHRRDGYNDSVSFNHHINAILDHPQTPTLPEISQILMQTEQNIKQITEGLWALTQYLQAKNNLHDLGGFCAENEQRRPDYVG